MAWTRQTYGRDLLRLFRQVTSADLLRILDDNWRASLLAEQILFQHESRTAVKMMRKNRSVLIGGVVLARDSRLRLR